MSNVINLEDHAGEGTIPSLSDRCAELDASLIDLQDAEDACRLQAMVIKAGLPARSSIDSAIHRLEMSTSRVRRALLALQEAQRWGRP